MHGVGSKNLLITGWGRERDGPVTPHSMSTHGLTTYGVLVLPDTFDMTKADTQKVDKTQVETQELTGPKLTRKR